MLHDVYIGLGSNLQQPQQQVQQALDALANLPLTQLHQQSALYQSQALTLPDDPKPQPDYVNAVVWLRTQLNPEILLDHLQAIEHAQGRQRGAQRWQARTLDLDILLYDDWVYASDRLLIPHPAMSQRAFVLYPLFDCNPQLVLPDGRILQTLLAKCAVQGLHKIAANER
jgi:2-amino-4-hydroxy-6-hydroxymethyldihydropteridine diphosphokinase